MEEYKVLTNLPEDYYFGTWEKKDVKAFGKWFMAEKENRMQMLFDEIHRDPEFVEWQPDFSPESLKTLGAWFERNIKWEPMPEDEFQEFIKKCKGMARYENKWITTKSKSLVFDVSIYFGEVLLRALEDRKWKQLLNVSIRNYDYGCMYIPFLPPHPHRLIVTPWRIVWSFAVDLIHYPNLKEGGIYPRYMKTYESLKDRLKSV